MTNINTITAIRDAAQIIVDQGTGLVPATYFSGVNHTLSWANRQMEKLQAPSSMPVVERLRKQLKDKEAAK